MLTRINKIQTKLTWCWEIVPLRMMFHCKFTMKLQRRAPGINGLKKKYTFKEQYVSFIEKGWQGRGKTERPKKYTHFCYSGYLWWLLLLLYGLGIWRAFADSFYFPAHRWKGNRVRACFIINLCYLLFLSLSLPPLPHLGSSSALQRRVGEGTANDKE